MSTAITIKKVLVLGGTGAQGRPVVRELTRDGKYFVTVLSRDINSEAAKEIGEWQNVTLLRGSYESEKDLRNAFKDQDGVYINFNSFGTTEARETFWTFRAYEIAVQSGVKWLVYSGGNNRPKSHGYSEKYRNSHQLTKGRLAEWIRAQPLSLIKWTIISGGVYTEMLSVLLRPAVLPDGTRVFSAPLGSGRVPFIETKEYGRYTRWIFDNPQRSVGVVVALPTYPTSLEEMPTAFTRVSDKPSMHRDVPQDEWFNAVSAYVDPDMKLPRGSAPDDDMTFTFRHSFGAWWNIWKAYKFEEEHIQATALADEIFPNRIRSVEEWMRAVGYTGEPKAELKTDKDREAKVDL